MKGIRKMIASWAHRRMTIRGWANFCGKGNSLYLDKVEYRHLKKFIELFNISAFYCMHLYLSIKEIKRKIIAISVLPSISLYKKVKIYFSTPFYEKN